MRKRSRSVLHAYLLPSARRGTRAAKPVSRATAANRDVAMRAAVNCASGAAFNAGDKRCEAVVERGRGAAEFVRPVDCSSSTENEAGVRKAVQSDDKEYDGDGDHYSSSSSRSDEAESLDGPYIPAVDRLGDLPPSCRAVQMEPNWLERAVMLARCSSRRDDALHVHFGTRTTNSNSHGTDCGGLAWLSVSLPDPALVCLNGGTEEEGCRAAAVAGITAAFYASRLREGMGAHHYMRAS
ncbi:hypothetical protein DQ04_08031020 [Trypanosoma grayi]|uniref:hypothetical protein n=1 Tax=Trypanosoma grayi TaxID=71804 RepID=UPI0004F4AC80|nr:hypothetical protein DQ04_08031020 [Trypanosoma grayi]KEG08088.1 hypothetical protein DQ04_08031020 [Trypanosoma grayi]